MRTLYKVAKKAGNKRFCFRRREKKQIHVEIKITGDAEIEELAEVAEALRMAMIKKKAIRSKTSYDISCNINEDVL